MSHPPSAPDGPQPPDPRHRYVIGLDLGLKHDRTVLAVCHAEHVPERPGPSLPRIVLDRPAVPSVVSSFQTTCGTPSTVARSLLVALRVLLWLMGLGPSTGSCQSASAAGATPASRAAVTTGRARRAAARRENRLTKVGPFHAGAESGRGLLLVGLGLLDDRAVARRVGDDA